MKSVILILILLLTIIINISKFSSLECNDQLIDHCTQCNSGDNSDSCAKCEEKYFPFFNDLLCLPCDDAIYGQSGCKGKCDATNYIIQRNVMCELGSCKEGFYYMNGICTPFNKTSPGCSKCTYEVQEKETKGNLTCNECESNEYKLNEFGKCEKCNMTNCQKCHYENNNLNKKCDQCIYSNYFVNSKGECDSCWYTYHEDYKGKECHVCSDNKTHYYDNCWGRDGYTEVRNSNCVECPPGCRKCNYNNKTKNTEECLNCFRGYVFDSNRKCIYCGEGCSSCTLDEKNNPICLNCDSGYYLNENKCITCSNGCSSCKLVENSKNKNETICIECNYYYALNPKNNNCTYCSNIPQLGDWGCKRCKYNNITNNYECLECWDKNYAYIINTYQCLKNYEPIEKYLYGCLRADYNEENNTYTCLQCKDNFLPVIK